MHESDDRLLYKIIIESQIKGVRNGKVKTLGVPFTEVSIRRESAVLHFLTKCGEPFTQETKSWLS